MCLLRVRNCYLGFYCPPKNLSLCVISANLLKFTLSSWRFTWVKKPAEQKILPGRFWIEAFYSETDGAKHVCIKHLAMNLTFDKYQGASCEERENTFVVVMTFIKSSVRFFQVKNISLPVELVSPDTKVRFCFSTCTWCRKSSKRLLIALRSMTRGLGSCEVNWLHSNVSHWSKRHF